MLNIPSMIRQTVTNDAAEHYVEASFATLEAGNCATLYFIQGLSPFHTSISCVQNELKKEKLKVNLSSNIIFGVSGSLDVPVPGSGVFIGDVKLGKVLTTCPSVPNCNECSNINAQQLCLACDTNYLLH